MNNKMRNPILKCFIGLFIISITSSTVFAAIWQNWRECANAPGCTCTITPDIKKSMSQSLKPYIIESAGYFLKSHDAFLKFLYCVEMSESRGLDSWEMKEDLYNAIYNMEKAKVAYATLKSASEKIPYNQEMIDKLMRFDYDGFRIKNGLNEPIFEKLKTFLNKGDIAGFDGAVIANMDVILSKLYEIKTSVDKGFVPETALLWRTFQSYAEAQLFGQYMSEVFRNILF